MENNMYKSRKDELDDFWDLEALIPNSAKKQVYEPKIKITEPVEIELVDKQDPRENLYSDQKFSGERDTLISRYVNPVSTYGKRSSDPICEYDIKDSLIHRVRVYQWQSEYNYYEKFCEQAEKLYDVEGKECPRVEFFSYMPQYNQLSRSQLEFYFWWRSCARIGKFIDVDYSYILLYAFEIINLSDNHDVKFLQEQLFSLWLSYRDRYPRLDKLLPEWIFDFSLINKLSAPKGRFPLSIITNNCGTAEFYVSATNDNPDKYINAILIWCSSYDYRKSRYYDGENKKLYDKYIPEALKEALTFSVSKGDGNLLGSFGYGDSKATRESYVGALCSYKRKRKIEIEFCSFSRSHELRYLVGDIVKFIENKLRAYLDIKSRLTVYSLSLELSSFLNNYLATVLPPKTRTARRKVVDEYEANYEIPRKPLSLRDAIKIENESWETTKTLVEAFVAETHESVGDSAIKPNGAQTNVETDSLSSRLGELYGYLLALYRKDDNTRKKEIERICALEDTIVDRINEITTDYIGDIIIDNDGSDFYVLEDYADMIEEK